MATYCISDIHGKYDLFIEMLKYIQFKDTDSLYILGDIFDKNSNVYEIYQYITAKDNIYMLKGNHEMMAEEAILYNFSDWYLWFHKNGGNYTYNSFYRHYDDFKDKYPVINREHFTKKEILAWVESLPIYKNITVNQQKFFLVHAGIDPHIALENQTNEDFLWIRDDFIYNETLFDNETIVIFGHTPTAYMNGLNNYHVWVDNKYKDKIGIDGGCFQKEGRLNCLRLDDMMVFTINVNDKLHEYYNLKEKD